MDRPFNVLFLCTGNSARSIMAEAILGKLGADRFHAYSAGSQPKGQVNSTHAAAVGELGYDTSGFRSKSWNEFARPGAPALDFVFTVCDNAAGEACPVWPGQPMTAHWGVPDPAAAKGTPAEVALAFRDAYRMLQQRIDVFAALPIRSLDQLTLQTTAQGDRPHGRRDREGAESRADAARLPQRVVAEGLGTASCSPPWSAPASWRSGSRAETSRSRCSATRCRPARSSWC